ncbi:MAG: transcription antitermination factor NusB [candidate division Zixibacteria bacterium]|nr:transcription antitermination factor NusB [candidate division Zixibacteria bacterium]
MSRRRQGRELVLGCLYAHYSAGENAESVFAGQAARVTYDSQTLDYARRIFFHAVEADERIDRTIRDGAAHWDFARIGSVEKNILRAAISELWFCPETPARVIIDEAVELAKDYAGAESGRFVNGILDWVYKRSEPKAAGGKEDGAQSKQSKQGGVNRHLP